MKKILTILLLSVFVMTFASFEFDGWNPTDVATGGENLTALSPDSFFTNVGNLSFFQHPHIAFNTMRLYNMKELEGLSFALIKPMKKVTIALGMETFGSEIYKEEQIHLGMGIHVGKNIGIGVKAKYMSLIMEDIGSASVWAIDIGAKYYVNYNLSLALRLKNISQPNIGQEYIYRDIGIGANYKFHSNFNIYFNMVTIIPPSYLKYTYGLTDLPDDEQQAIEDNIWNSSEYDAYLENFGDKKNIHPDFHIGMSYRLFNFINFLGGIEILSDRDIAYSLGVNVSGKGLGLSYSFKTHAELGTTHYFSFTIGEKEFIRDLSIVNGKININIASAAEIAGIPGIGSSTSNAIVAYREKVGRIKSIDELVNVKRIGKRTIEKIRPYIFINKKKAYIEKSDNTIIKKSNPSLLVDINSASKKELMALPRIGEKTAQHIIEYRKLHKGFKNKEDIMNVSRIGQKTYDNFKDSITAGPYDPAVDK